MISVSKATCSDGLIRCGGRHQGESIRKYLILIALVSVITVTVKPSEPVVQNVNNLVTTTQQPVSIPPEKTEAQSQTKVPEKVQPQVKPQPVQQPAVAKKPTVSGSKQDWLRQANIPENEWQAVDFIVSKESSWNYLAVNKSSGATGLCQALPASKMAKSGADYLTNPVTQLKWCHDYAMTRYGGWWKSFAFWQANRWW